METATTIGHPQKVIARKRSRRAAIIGLDDYPLDIHGAQELFRHSDSCNKRKIFWLCVILISAVVSVFSCYNVAIEYYQNSTATQIILKQVTAVPLPRLTLCSTSPDVFRMPQLMEYLSNHFPNASDELLEGFVAYFTAGSGFQKMNQFTSRLNTSSVAIFDLMYRQLRGSRTIAEYFHYFFDEYGLNCDELFTRCRLGDRNLPCCEIFEVSYTVRRGRCFSLKPIDQVKADDLGKLTIYMNYSRKLMNTDLHDLVVFVSDHLVDVAPFPRYFIRPDHFCKLRLSARRISLLPEHPTKCWDHKCGKGTCYLNRSLGRSHSKYNCTPPYWPKPKHKHTVPMAACDPKVIVDHYYKMVMDEEQDVPGQTPCVLPCERWEYGVIWEDPKSERSFERWRYQLRLEISYTDLQYAVIREVKTVTFWGFVSQIGGQLGLFLGSSIISLFQLTLFIGFLAKKSLTDYMKSSPKDKRPDENDNLTVKDGV